MKEAEISLFHGRAKDAGNRLSALVTNSAIGAVAVYFIALVQGQIKFSVFEKWCLVTALILFVVTVLLRFFELHLDAQRFYLTATQLAKPEDQQNWREKDIKQAVRLKIIWFSYYSYGLAMLFSILVLVSRII